MRGEPVYAQPKPLRGSRVLAKEADDAAFLALERRVKTAVKKRDGRCRWPEKHKCRCGLEAVHVKDASLLGPMIEWNLVTFCGWIHRRGPESIHGKQLKVIRETPKDAKVPLFSFWRQDDRGEYFLIAREIAPFVYERD